MVKKKVPLDRAYRLLTPGPVTLVTASRKGRFDITPIGWSTIVGMRPPLVAIAVFEANFIHELIRASGEFVVNVPGHDIVKQVLYCGHVSGRDVDKFQAPGLHPDEPEKVDAPPILECLAHLECALVDVITPGDHSIFIGEIVAAKAMEEAFDDAWLLQDKELKPIHHLGGRDFAVLEERIKAQKLEV